MGDSRKSATFPRDSYAACNESGSTIDKAAKWQPADRGMNWLDAGATLDLKSRIKP